MSITIKKELGYYDIKEETWECEKVFENIENAEKEEEFMNLLEEYQELMNGDSEEIPTITELNDYIRFQTNEIYEYLGLNENGEIEDEE